VRMLSVQPEPWRLARPWLVVCLVYLFLPGAAEPAGSAGFLEEFALQTPAERVEAPTFSLPAVDRTRVSLADFRGKMVLLNFFATWCGPCREEMPGMERLHRVYRNKGLVVLAVDMQEGREAVAAFMRELKLSFPSLLDGDGEVAYQYGLRGVPATFLIGRGGEILWRAYGGREWDGQEAQRYFSRILADGPR
jgi:thiol-disulfide isomerase/thioredoxin